MKRSGLQYDDRIVECVWDLQGGPVIGAEQVDDDIANGIAPSKQPQRAPAWRIHRIRDDKREGNHCSIVKKIMESIVDGVEEHEVVAVAPEIRVAWKSEPRESLRKAFEAGAVGASTQQNRRLPAHGESSALSDIPFLSRQPSSRAVLDRRRPLPPMPTGPPGVYRL